MKSASFLVILSTIVVLGPSASHAEHLQSLGLQGLGCDAFASTAEIPAKQADRLEAFVNQLDSARTQAQRVYFVGIAFWDDGLFENDIDLIDCRIRSRFGNDVLSAMLSNSDRDKYLIPKTSMIKKVTSEIASISDEETDLVIVYITSHGTPNKIHTKRARATGYVRDSSLARMFKSLRGLRTVFFVQACYSGSLIDKLEAPRRIIITAAAATRTERMFFARRRTWRTLIPKCGSEVIWPCLPPRTSALSSNISISRVSPPASWVAYQRLLSRTQST
jgi:hypothetical protein